MRLRRARLFIASTFAASTLAMPAMAAPGDGGYAKITPLSDPNDTVTVVYENGGLGGSKGKGVTVTPQKLTARYKLQGAAGKHRVFKSWGVSTQSSGEFESSVNQSGNGVFSHSIDLGGGTRDWNNRAWVEGCNDKISIRAAETGQNRSKISKKGWTTTFKIAVNYKATMTVDDKLSPFDLFRNDSATKYFKVKCIWMAADEKDQHPKKQKPKAKNVNRETAALRATKPSRAATTNENKRGRPTEEVAFIFNNTAPARETEAPRMTAGNDKIAIAPRSDLYAESGGLNPDDHTSFVLLIGNKGGKTAPATELRFFLNMKGQKTLQAQYPIPDIKAGGFHELHVPSLIPLDWIETAYARIDQPNIIAEMDEKNNGFSFVQNKQARLKHDTAKAMIDNIRAYKRPEHIAVSEISQGQATGKRTHKPLTFASPKE